MTNETFRLDGGGEIEGKWLQSDGGEMQFIEGHGAPLDQQTNKGPVMHYRNGREAKNGDKVVKLNGGEIAVFGVLHSAIAGNDYCNGSIAPITDNTGACICDMLHVDDVAAILAEKGLDKRPAGK